MVAVFVDRDGVINVNRSTYVRSVDDLRFLPGAVEGLIRLSARGYEVFVITNQAAVGRGQLSAVEARTINDYVVATVEEAGGRIQAVFACSHTPEDGCPCRKPRAGLLYSARDRFGIELEKAYLIGDHWTDIAAGASAGCTSILVLSGRWRESAEGIELAPHHVATDLARAVDLVLDLEALRFAPERLPVSPGLRPSGKDRLAGIP